MVEVPNVFSSGATIVADDVNANFDTLEAALSNLANANLSDTAGITSAKLTDRYAIIPIVFQLVPNTSGTDLAAPAEFTTPATDVVLHRHRVTLRTGQEAYLCEVEFYVHDITLATTAYPTLGIQVQGTVVGGSTVTINNDEQYWRIRNSNPLDSPFLALNDGDVIGITVGRSDTSAFPLIAGVWVRLVLKVRLTN